MTGLVVARLAVGIVLAAFAVRHIDREVKLALESDDVFGDDFLDLRRRYWRHGLWSAGFAGMAGGVALNPAIGAGFAGLAMILALGNALWTPDLVQPASVHERKNPDGRRRPVR